MLVELTNHYIEASVMQDIENIIEETYGSVTYFKFYYGEGKYSKEYKTPTYSYRVLKT